MRAPFKAKIVLFSKKKYIKTRPKNRYFENFSKAAPLPTPFEILDQPLNGLGLGLGGCLFPVKCFRETLKLQINVLHFYYYQRDLNGIGSGIERLKKQRAPAILPNLIIVPVISRHSASSHFLYMPIITYMPSLSPVLVVGYHLCQLSVILCASYQLSNLQIISYHICRLSPVPVVGYHLAGYHPAG